MKTSRFVDLVRGGKRGRRAWRSLRKQLDADLERRLRRGRRWAAVQELMAHAAKRDDAREVEAYLITARDLFKRLAKDTDSPDARAACHGVAAAISLRLGDTKRARNSVRKSMWMIQRTISVDTRHLRGARRLRYHDLLYRQLYLGNEVMALRRYLGEELIVIDGGASKTGKRSAKQVTVRAFEPRKAPHRKRATVGGRAKMPTWDEILFGATRAPQ